jgi:hypothetical protein
MKIMLIKKSIQKKANGEYNLDQTARDAYLIGKVETCQNQCGLHEYYCGPGEYIVGDIVECPNGCNAGACVLTNQDLNCNDIVKKDQLFSFANSNTVFKYRDTDRLTTDSPKAKILIVENGLPPENTGQTLEYSVNYNNYLRNVGYFTLMNGGYSYVFFNASRADSSEDWDLRYMCSEVTCTDSDLNNDPKIKGLVTFSNGTTVTDSCYDNYYLDAVCWTSACPWNNPQICHQKIVLRNCPEGTTCQSSGVCG